ncbi:MAG: tRNA lysidine(34) synthetase TilS [Clostridia bacterium]|nr:tRNA lysidine(34) synthetase TilS [Clostridia bacterium]
MFADFSKLNKKPAVVGFAVSGGKDSMALLYYAYKNRKTLNLTPVCINVEHGIRGEQSKNDSLFVKDFCDSLGIPFYGYVVDCPTYSNQNKLSIEQGARVLRYNCFYDALSKNLCDVIATAHHRRDNVESVLFNMFRGSGLNGLKGINDYDDKIIRPLLYTSKRQIDEYVKQENVPYVTDGTNFDTDYTRNYIRLEVLPVVKKVFPEAERSISRLIKTVREDDDYLTEQAKKLLTVQGGLVKIPVDSPKPLFCRATIMALKELGLEKDWEKVHVDDAYALTSNKNGCSINLPKDIVAIREYDFITFYKSTLKSQTAIPLTDGKITVGDSVYLVETLDVKTVNLKDGIYLDKDKVLSGAIIRYKEKGDVFTKIGGGSKKLVDYFTDKKIPKRLRDYLPLVAVGSEILAILDLTVSEKVIADETTKQVIKITKES